MTSVKQPSKRSYKQSVSFLFSERIDLWEPRKKKSHSSFCTPSCVYCGSRASGLLGSTFKYIWAQSRHAFACSVQCPSVVLSRCVRLCCTTYFGGLISCYACACCQCHATYQSGNNIRDCFMALQYRLYKVLRTSVNYGSANIAALSCFLDNGGFLLPHLK